MDEGALADIRKMGVDPAKVSEGEKLYGNMHRNATYAFEFLKLPIHRIVDLRAAVQI